MSTLGDLLAEHTMLPGNAVDHLHAVVGEWQLLADLSFADYLMWVRRDDGVLVCVAQCRPTTAPTVLQTDAVGTVVAADRMPLVAETFASGTAQLESDAGQEYSWQLPGLNVEAVPGAVRRPGGGGADAHQTALADDEVRPAGDRLPGLRRGPCPHAVRGHLSRRGGRGDVALHPAGG